MGKYTNIEYFELPPSDDFPSLVSTIKMSHTVLLTLYSIVSFNRSPFPFPEIPYDSAYRFGVKFKLPSLFLARCFQMFIPPEGSELLVRLVTLKISRRSSLVQQMQTWTDQRNANFGSVLFMNSIVKYFLNVQSIYYIRVNYH